MLYFLGYLLGGLFTVGLMTFLAGKPEDDGQAMSVFILWPLAILFIVVMLSVELGNKLGGK